MQLRALLPAACLVMLAALPAAASDCPGNPDAIGVSRTIVVDPAAHPRVGGFQYPETLPLADKEVVLTFDDAPRLHVTAKVLDILARECVKATYFVIGRPAREYPDLVRRIRAEGHTLAVHSETHPLSFPQLSQQRLKREVEGAIASIRAAFGPEDENAVAPFFRIPGLIRSESVDRYLNDKGLMVWSTDVMAHDWKRRINEPGIIRRALDRLAAKGKGILLLHDVKEKTAEALPVLLRELKERGYRIVHVVPATAARPKTPTGPADWVFHAPAQPPLPVLLMADIARLNETWVEQKSMSPVDLCGETAGIRAQRVAESRRTSRQRRASAHTRKTASAAAPRGH